MGTTKKNRQGNLRSRLLTTASEMISKEGLSRLTMRELSQRLGVSRTAPYRHFVNKNDLLCAIAEQGFIELQNRYKEINDDRATDASTRFQRIGMAYVEYALKNPGPYRLMFGHELINQKRTPGLLQAAQATFTEFLAAIEAFQKENRIDPDNLMSIANISWITVHGLSTLLIEDQFIISDETKAMPSLLAGNNNREMDKGREKIEFSKKIMADSMDMILSR